MHDENHYRNVDNDLYTKKKPTFQIMLLQNIFWRSALELCSKYSHFQVFKAGYSLGTLQ